MGEALRRYYLQTLGVECYEPRWVLRNAAPSPLVIAESLALGVNVENGAKVTSVENAANIESEISLGNSNVVPTISAAANKPPVGHLSQANNPQQDRLAAIAAKSRQPKVQPIYLSVWRVSDDLLVVDSRQVAAALPTEALLANIVHALGYNASLPAVENIRWPLTPGANLAELHDVAAAEVEARDYVQAFIEAQFERKAFRTVLAMGATAAKVVLPANAWPTSNDARELLGKTIASANYHVIVVPSLVTMLQKPATKALTWQAIQSLRCTT